MAKFIPDPGSRSRWFPGRIQASGIYDAKRLPFALLAGDGKLARQIIEAAAKNELRLDIRMELESFSLLLEAVKTRNLGAVVPEKAVGELPQDEFAVIEDDQFAILPRPSFLSPTQKRMSYDRDCAKPSKNAPASWHEYVQPPRFR